MMTTVQLGQRMLRFYKGGISIGNLPAAEAALLVDAVNFGLKEFLASLPDNRLGTSAAWLLRAPIQQSISIVAGATGFSYVAGSPYPEGGYASEADAIGHSVMVSGDSQLNLLNRSGELLSPYNGSTGTVTMTIYGDAANMGENDQRLLSGVDLVESGGRRTDLVHFDNPDLLHLRHDVEFGIPFYWYTAPHMGQERTTSPLWHLRVWPIPQVQCNLRARMLSFPASLTFEDFHAARNLPLKVDEEALLIALIAPGLRSSAHLAAHIRVPDLDWSYARAKEALAGVNQPQHSVPAKIRTQEGY